MPQHKSCKKRLKTNARREERNRAARSALRKSLRKYRELADTDRASAYSGLQAVLDKAVNKGIVSRNRAARLKSRLNPAT
jgi:small subunit ribosomal protein S20